MSVARNIEPIRLILSKEDRMRGPPSGYYLLYGMLV